jgi:metal-responsive CopG/Arc/MetJ family transcriptional regulator
MARTDDARASAQKRMTRLQVMLSARELHELDNFRFQKRMPSRASAIREILRRGLMAQGFDMADGDARSKQFGVIADESRSSGSVGNGR